VNKMDMVGYSEEQFIRLSDDFFALAASLGISSVLSIPISALEGDNIVERGQNMPWYGGPTLLEHLETVPIEPAARMNALRFPVQSVIRPDGNFRGFAGRVASGSVRPGDELLALPSRQKARVDSIVTFDGELREAHASQSITLKLAKEIDLSRGDLLVAADAPPHVSRSFNAMVVWMHRAPLELNRFYLAKHLGRYVRAKATRLRFLLDVDTLEERTADKLDMNEIAWVDFETAEPLYFDTYEFNRSMGSFILIDPLTNLTVGAAMIREPLREQPTRSAISEPETVATSAVTLAERILRRGHRPAIFATQGDRRLAEQFERALLDRGFEAVLVDIQQFEGASRQSVVKTLVNLGLVVVAWREKGLRPKERGLLQTIGDEFSLDVFLEAQALAGRGLDRVLQIAESLRTKGRTGANWEA
jgi:bifunctional enzyme CysN/CysC